MASYKEDVSARCSELTRQVVRGKVDLPVPEAATLVLYLRFLKRISAHSRNLISSLVNPFDRIGYPE